MKSAFSKNPILVIDRVGLIGQPLCLRLSREFPVVFVSRRSSDFPFSGKFPVIPDNKYSHIIFIDEDGRDSGILPRIIEKVKDVNADFILAFGLVPNGEYEISKIIRLCPGVKIAIFGDIFDNELITNGENFKSVINKFIYQAQRFGKMQVLGDGLRETYPVFLEDVVGGLIDLVFGMKKSHSLFYIFPKHPPSELSLAHMIQKINPEIMIDFVKYDPRRKNISYPPDGEYLLNEKYLLAQKIRGIDMNKILPNGEKARGKPRSYSFAVWVLIFLLLSPLLFTIFFSSLGFNTLYYAKKEMDRGNFSGAQSSLRLSSTLFYLGKQAANILFSQVKIVGGESSVKKILPDLDSSYRVSESLLQIFNSGAYFEKILTGKSQNPVGDLTKGRNYLRNSFIALDGVKAEGKIPAQISQNLEIINPLIKFLSVTSDIMPNILGMEGPKIYLILFQDNLELRPGGGVIDYYGILKFDMGKITEFSINDVSDADAQLRGHVEPPLAVRRYLPSVHWYMRDSGFDVDFAKGALAASNFLFVETGQKVSGIIAIDTSFIKKILHATGPIYVKDYRKTIDEKNFSFGLVQQKNLLKSLGREVMLKMAGGKPPRLLIAQAISDALVQKHLLFTSEDWQNTLTVNGWSSSLWDERVDGENFVNDFVGISEANLGMNKINSQIKRGVSQKIVIGDAGNISEELTVNYENESAADGDYKNYLRIILPKDTILSEILINDMPQVLTDAIVDPSLYEGKNFKAPLGIEVEKVRKDSNEVFGFLVKVPAGETVIVKLKYMLAKNAGLNNFSYNLKLFKQPGIDSLPYYFSLVYPSFLKVIKSSDGVEGVEEKATYSEKVLGDKNLIINFSKK